MPIALLLLTTLFAAPVSERSDYAMRVDGVLVGRVSVKVEGGLFEYRSESLVRRGPTVTRNEALARGELGEAMALRRLDSQRREGGVLVSSVSAQQADGRLRLSARTNGGAVRHSLAPQAAVPSALAPALLDVGERTCLPVVDELSGRTGLACGRREGQEVVGELLGDRFVAKVVAGRLARLEFPQLRTSFERGDGPPALLAPPDLFGAGVAVPGLAGIEEDERVRFVFAAPEALPETAAQRVSRMGGRAEVRWRRIGPRHAEPSGAASFGEGSLAEAARRLCSGSADRWSVARAIARFVDDHVEDAPAAGERSAERVFSERRGTCVGHAVLFLELARRCGLPSRPALGLVAGEGRLWGHAWVQVEVSGAWWDVDPSEGWAPPRSARLLVSAGEDADEKAAARLFARLPSLRIEALPDDGAAR